jgi:hypothetical protein
VTSLRCRFAATAAEDLRTGIIGYLAAAVDAAVLQNLKGLTLQLY